MKKLVLVVFSLMLLSAPAYAGSSADSTSAANASSYVGGMSQGQETYVAPNQSVNITQNSNIPAGQGRLLLNIPPVPTAPLINYFGPWKESANILETNFGLPTNAVYRGYVFLKGDGDATTIDLLMKAFMDAMDSGASKIVILKKQATTKNTATGISIGIGGGVSSLSGSEKENGVSVGGGLGFSWGASEPKYQDGMAVLMIE